MAKVVLITGCSSGLGAALAARLAGVQHPVSGEPAYRVFATARRPETLAGLKAAGVETAALDVGSTASVEAAVAGVLAAAGRIDVLINNAGLSRNGPLAEQPLEEVQQIFDTNVLGVVRTTQAVSRAMIAQRSGLVMMIGSVTSWVTTPFGGAYSASKAALLSMADALRLELAPFGVQVSYVTAGAIRSALSDNALAGMDMSRYEAPASAYRTMAAGISARARMSQDDKSVMAAEDVADQIIAVVNRSMLGGKAAPTWFLAGGSALYFWAVGFVQKLFGWPVNGVLLKKFGLHQLDAAPAPPPS